MHIHPVDNGGFRFSPKFSFIRCSRSYVDKIREIFACIGLAAGIVPVIPTRSVSGGKVPWLRGVSESKLLPSASGL